MDSERRTQLAEWSNIGTFLLSIALLLFDWVKPLIAKVGGPMNSGWPEIVLAAAVLISSVITWRSRRNRLESARLELARLEAEKATSPESKLKIHSAWYGIANSNDIDVTRFLSQLPKEGISVQVGNNLIPGIADPALGKVKRLEVNYSFGYEANLTCVRYEGEQLILPEDIGVKQRTAYEYDAKLRKMLAEQLDALILNVRRLQAIDGGRKISQFSTDNWMTQNLPDWEKIGRESKCQLIFARRLAKALNVDLDRLSRLGQVELLHELENIRRTL